LKPSSVGADVGRGEAVPQPDTEANLDKLTLHLQVHTVLRMDEGQAVTRLSASEWPEYRRKLSEMGDVEPASNRSTWHDACAWDAEENGDAFAALWHLERFAALRPADWQTYARMGRLYADAGDFTRAATA
jgi:hypothetical protein